MIAHLSNHRTPPPHTCHVNQDTSGAHGIRMPGQTAGGKPCVQHGSDGPILLRHPGAMPTMPPCWVLGGGGLISSHVPTMANEGLDAANPGHEALASRRVLSQGCYQGCYHRAVDICGQAVRNHLRAQTGQQRSVAATLVITSNAGTVCWREVRLCHQAARVGNCTGVWLTGQTWPQGTLALASASTSTWVSSTTPPQVSLAWTSTSRWSGQATAWRAAASSRPRCALPRSVPPTCMMQQLPNDSFTVSSATTCVHM